MQNLALVLTVAVLTVWCAGMIHPAAIGLRGMKRAKVCIWGFGATLLAITLSRSVPSGSVWDISDTTAGLIVLPLLIGWPSWAMIKLVRDVLASRRSPSAVTEAAPVATRAESTAQVIAPAAPTATPKPKPSASNSPKPARAPEPSSKPVSKAPSLKPNKPSRRAIDTGWSRGTISFEYVDNNGDWSMRTVTVHSVSSTRIKGECHMRRAERTFLLERIEGDIVDLETGEVLDPEDWAAQYA